MNEYYDNTVNSGSATGVVVSAGSETGDIDFSLALSFGGSISGRVTRDLDGAGIPGVRMDLYDSSWTLLNVTTVTNSSGYYTLGGILVGSYYVKTVNQMGYQDEYFDNSVTAGGATPVSVAVFTDTPNIDFSLGVASGGTISGRVTRDSDGAGLPGVEVEVFDSQRNRLTSAFTDASGNYTVGVLPPGNYYVVTSNQQGYIDEYFSNFPRPVSKCMASFGSNACRRDDRLGHPQYSFWVIFGRVDFGTGGE